MAKKQKFAFKFIAFFLAFTMILSDALYAAPVERFLDNQTPLQLLLQDPGKFEAPLNFSTLKEIHKGNANTFIIHIQDAHANLSGQQNLANTLDALMKKYDVRLVLVEGGSKDDSLTALKKMAPAQVWKKVSKKFLFEGKISGEEYLNLISDHPMKIMGIEDKELYMTSLQAYTELAEKREKILVYLTKLENAVEKLKNKLYPAELLEYEKISPDTGHRTQDKSYETGFKKLVQLDQADDQFTDLPNVQRLIAIQDREAQIDFNFANLEQAALIEQIAKRGGRQELERSLSGFSKIKNQRASQLNFVQLLFKTALEKNISLEGYPHLMRYREYLGSFSEIDFERFFDERERMEDKVYLKYLNRAFAQSSNVLLLRSIDRYLALLETAYRIQMSTKEFEQLKINAPDFDAVAMVAFLNRLLGENGYIQDMMTYSPALEEGKESLKRFYQSVGERDFAFMQNAQRILSQEKERVAVWIAGGYHTEHLKQLFKEKDFSYAVLTPTVTAQTSQSKYEKVLLQPIKKEVKTVIVNGERHEQKEWSSIRGQALVENNVRLAELIQSVSGLSEALPAAVSSQQSVVRQGQNNPLIPDYRLRTIETGARLSKNDLPENDPPDKKHTEGILKEAKSFGSVDAPFTDEEMRVALELHNNLFENLSGQVAFNAYRLVTALEFRMESTQPYTKDEMDLYERALKKLEVDVASSEAQTSSPALFQRIVKLRKRFDDQNESSGARLAQTYLAKRIAEQLLGQTAGPVSLIATDGEEFLLTYVPLKNGNFAIEISHRGDQVGYLETELAGNVVGSVHYERNRFSEAEEPIFVSERYRMDYKGLNSALAAVAMHIARTHGHSEFRAVSVNNQQARDFYLYLGFEPVGKGGKEYRYDFQKGDSQDSSVLNQINIERKPQWLFYKVQDVKPGEKGGRIFVVHRHETKKISRSIITFEGNTHIDLFMLGNRQQKFLEQFGIKYLESGDMQWPDLKELNVRIKNANVPHRFEFVPADKILGNEQYLDKLMENKVPMATKGAEFFHDMNYHLLSFLLLMYSPEVVEIMQSRIRLIREYGRIANESGNEAWRVQYEKEVNHYMNTVESMMAEILRALADDSSITQGKIHSAIYALTGRGQSSRPFVRNFVLQAFLDPQSPEKASRKDRALLKIAFGGNDSLMLKLFWLSVSGIKLKNWSETLRDPSPALSFLNFSPENIQILRRIRNEVFLSPTPKIISETQAGVIAQRLLDLANASGARLAESKLTQYAPWDARQLFSHLFPLRLPVAIQKQLTDQGLSAQDIEVILRQSAEPMSYRYIYDYELGIQKIRQIINGFPGPTLLVIEGAAGSGKSYLSNRLMEGSDLGLNPKDIATVIEDDILPMDYDANEVSMMTSRLLFAGEQNPKLIIYDGHMFTGSWGATNVFDGVRNVLKEFNIVRVAVKTIRKGADGFYTINGGFQPAVRFSDPYGWAKLQNIKRYIEITPDYLLKKSVQGARLAELGKFSRLFRFTLAASVFSVGQSLIVQTVSFAADRAANLAKPELTATVYQPIDRNELSRLLEGLYSQSGQERQQVFQEVMKIFLRHPEIQQETLEYFLREKSFYEDASDPTMSFFFKEKAEALLNVAPNRVDILWNLFQSSSYEEVRMEALKLLSTTYLNSFVDSPQTYQRAVFNDLIQAAKRQESSREAVKISKALIGDLADSSHIKDIFIRDLVADGGLSGLLMEHESDALDQWLRQVTTSQELWDWARSRDTSVRILVLKKIVDWKDSFSVEINEEDAKFLISLLGHPATLPVVLQFFSKVPLSPKYLKFEDAVTLVQIKVAAELVGDSRLAAQAQEAVTLTLNEAGGAALFLNSLNYANFFQTEAEILKIVAGAKDKDIEKIRFQTFGKEGLTIYDSLAGKIRKELKQTLQEEDQPSALRTHIEEILETSLDQESSVFLEKLLSDPKITTQTKLRLQNLDHRSRSVDDENLVGYPVAYHLSDFLSEPETRIYAEKILDHLNLQDLGSEDQAELDARIQFKKTYRVSLDSARQRLLGTVYDFIALANIDRRTPWEDLKRKLELVDDPLARVYINGGFGVGYPGGPGSSGDSLMTNEYSDYLHRRLGLRGLQEDLLEIFEAKKGSMPRDVRVRFLSTLERVKKVYMSSITNDPVAVKIFTEALEEPDSQQTALDFFEVNSRTYGDLPLWRELIKTQLKLDVSISKAKREEKDFLPVLLDIFSRESHFIRSKTLVWIEKGEGDLSEQVLRQPEALQAFIEESDSPDLGDRVRDIFKKRMENPIVHQAIFRKLALEKPQVLAFFDRREVLNMLEAARDAVAYARALDYFLKNGEQNMTVAEQSLDLLLHALGHHQAASEAVAVLSALPLSDQKLRLRLIAVLINKKERAIQHQDESLVQATEHLLEVYFNRPTGPEDFKRFHETEIHPGIRAKALKFSNSGARLAEELFSKSFWEENSRQRQEALALIGRDESAQLVYTDMMKLRLRNEVYGTAASDYFIWKTIQIAQQKAAQNAAYAFRVGPKSDEVILVVAGSVDARGLADSINAEIKDFFGQHVGFARFKAALTDDQKQAAVSFKEIKSMQSLSGLAEDGSVVYSDHFLFETASGESKDAFFARLLDKMGIREDQAVWTAVLPPFLPAGIVDSRAAVSSGQTDPEKILASAIELAQVYQGVAKDRGLLSGTAQMVIRPSRTTEHPLFSEIIAKSIEEENALLRLGLVDTAPARDWIEKEYASVGPSYLREALQEAMRKDKGQPGFEIIRGPPENFFFLSWDGHGGWQLTLVKQTVIVKDPALKAAFFDLRAASRREGESESKFGFKQPNDYFGPLGGNRLIKLVNSELLKAFRRASSKSPTLDHETIFSFVSEAEFAISRSTLPAGFELEAHAITAQSADFENEAGAPEVILSRLKDLSDARASAQETTMDRYPSVSLRDYSENKSHWPAIADERAKAKAYRRARAEVELHKAHDKILGARLAENVALLSAVRPEDRPLIEKVLKLALEFRVKQNKQSNQSDVALALLHWLQSLDMAIMLAQWKAAPETIGAALLYEFYDSRSDQKSFRRMLQSANIDAPTAKRIVDLMDHLQSLVRINFSPNISDSRSVPNFMNLIMLKAGDYEGMIMFFSKKIAALNFIGSRSHEDEVYRNLPEGLPLADKLRGLSESEDSVKRIETYLEFLVYSSLAEKTGVSTIAEQIRSTAFTTLFPNENELIQAEKKKLFAPMSETKVRALLNQELNLLRKTLAKADLSGKSVRVEPLRFKSNARIWEKMVFGKRTKSSSVKIYERLKDFNDILATRVISNSNEVTGVVNQWLKKSHKSFMAIFDKNKTPFRVNRDYEGTHINVDIQLIKKGRQKNVSSFEIIIMTQKGLESYISGSAPEWMTGSNDIAHFSTVVNRLVVGIPKQRFRRITPLTGQPAVDFDNQKRGLANRIYIPFYRVDSGEIRSMRVMELAEGSLPLDLAAMLDVVGADYEGFIRYSDVNKINAEALADNRPLENGQALVLKSAQTGERRQKLPDNEAVKWKAVRLKLKALLAQDPLLESKVKMLKTHLMFERSRLKKPKQYNKWVKRGERQIKNLENISLVKNYAEHLNDFAADLEVSVADLKAAVGSGLVAEAKFETAFEDYVRFKGEVFPSLPIVERRPTKGARLASSVAGFQQFYDSKLNTTLNPDPKMASKNPETMYFLQKTIVGWLPGQRQNPGILPLMTAEGVLLMTFTASLPGVQVQFHSSVVENKSTPYRLFFSKEQMAAYKQISSLSLSQPPMLPQTAAWQTGQEAASLAFKEEARQVRVFSSELSKLLSDHGLGAESLEGIIEINLDRFNVNGAPDPTPQSLDRGTSVGATDSPVISREVFESNVKILKIVLDHLKNQPRYGKVQFYFYGKEKLLQKALKIGLSDFQASEQARLAAKRRVRITDISDLEKNVGYITIADAESELVYPTQPLLHYALYLLGVKNVGGNRMNAGDISERVLQEVTRLAGNPVGVDRLEKTHIFAFAQGDIRQDFLNIALQYKIRPLVKLVNQAFARYVEMLRAVGQAA